MVLRILIFSLISVYSKLCNHILRSLHASHPSIYCVYSNYLINHSSLIVFFSFIGFFFCLFWSFSVCFCFLFYFLINFFSNIQFFFLCVFPSISSYLFIYCIIKLHKLPRWALAPGVNVKKKILLKYKKNYLLNYITSVKFQTTKVWLAASCFFHFSYVHSCY